MPKETMEDDKMQDLRTFIKALLSRAERAEAKLEAAEAQIQIQGRRADAALESMAGLLEGLCVGIEHAVQDCETEDAKLLAMTQGFREMATEARAALEVK